MTQSELKKLLDSMTLEEKIFELFQLSPAFYGDEGVETGPAVNLGIKLEDAYQTNSVLNFFGAERVIKIKNEHYKKNRHHIPMMMMADIIHGYSTILPPPIAMGCSFDTDLVKKCYQNTAKEASVSGVDAAFAPMVDLVRDPRWGRVVESTGEDPYLNSEMCRAMVEGLQGDGLENEGTISACVKHFAAYGAVEGGREYNSVDMSERFLRQYYLPAYKAGVDAGAEMIMSAFNTVGGRSSTGDNWLMRDILRDEWGFDGVVISDWGSTTGCIPQGICKDERKAAKRSIESGLDIEMCTPLYIRHLKNLVEEGEVDVKYIDESVMRVLKLKNKLGLFENPIRYTSVEDEQKYCHSEQIMADAGKMVCASSVLLKNDGILPLTEKSGKVAFIGPYVDCERFCGAWAKVGMPIRNKTIREAAEGKGDYLFAKGSHRLGAENLLESYIIKYEVDDTDREELAAEAERVAASADTVVMLIGEHFDQSGEAKSHMDIRIPAVQIELLKRVHKVNPNIAVVLFNGRPLDVREIVENSRAILDVWMPGSAAADAIYSMLVGETEPSGRLSMTFPYMVGQIPSNYARIRTDHKYNPDPNVRFTSRYSDAQSEPMYPFGHGMGYTTFEYSDLTVESVLTRGGKITASVKVKNTGDRKGSETVQMYISDDVATVARPYRELKGFSKVTLDAGEERTVSFEINEELLKYWNVDMEYVADDGDFTVFIGHDSNCSDSVKFTLK